jgi:hypothetical protein
LPSNPYETASATPPQAAAAGANPYLAGPASTVPSVPPMAAATAPVLGPIPFSAPAASAPVASPSVSKASPLAALDPLQSLSSLFGDVRNSIPILNGQDLLPTIKKVYPTGEKPLVILSFKCPTEMLGVTPPPMKALHELINLAFDGVNKTNLLSFNMQQVCQ